ncbi:dienelactone hydrolase family protein [bacterium]|nr:dienelactone hydrolase family protein [bacterium]
MKRTVHGLPTHVFEAQDPKAPLVVALHGIGSNEDDLPNAYQPLADRVALAFPRSPLSHPPGYAWYRLIRFGVPEEASFAQALEILDAWLDELRQLPGMAERPLVLSGFSQGAIMSLSYALRHPEKVAGVMAFSGYIPQLVLDALPSGSSEGADLKVFLTLGQRDALFPFAWLAQSAQQLQARGIQPEVVAHDGGHEIPPPVMEAAIAWLSRAFSI